MRCRLTRVVVFHARHRYYRSEWDLAENRRRFGWTAEAPGHGHLYRVECTVSGPMDTKTSMVMDLAELDQQLDRLVVRPLSGQQLNDVIPRFQDETQLPTCEAMACWCWEQLQPVLPQGVVLSSVLVAEDDTLWAECVG